jgi:tRNA dimethylallyltransferase
MEQQGDGAIELTQCDSGQQHVIPVIVGPTASGKTSLALELARDDRRIEIVSADSRQVYAGMDIGTAKPSAEQLRETPHHMIDVVPPTVNYTAGDFALDARVAINNILQRGGRPLIAGGSGFYIRALFHGLGAPTVDQSVYDSLVERANREGYDTIYQELLRIDPLAAQAQSANNRVKVFRALACYVQTGRLYSSFLEGDAIEQAAFVPRYLGLAPPRPELYHRINQRVIEMVEAGLVEEVQGLLRQGLPLDAPGFRTVGYEETLDYLAGKLSREAMIHSIQQSTRRYAKRQLTWFRKVADVHWIAEPDLHAAQGWLQCCS